MNLHHLCTFCAQEGGTLLYRSALFRVVLTDEPLLGFCRLIWNTHVAEWSDLDANAQWEAVRALSATESVLRALLKPTKMNLASLGNQVPHVHWHIIPRFSDDPYFPDSVWGKARREAAPRVAPAHFIEDLRAGLANALSRTVTREAL